MLSHTEFEKVYLVCGGTDMRKSIDGLAALVQQGFALDPFASCLFAFCNKDKNKLKILQWDYNGFWLLHIFGAPQNVTSARERAARTSDMFPDFLRLLLPSGSTLILRLQEGALSSL